VEVLVAVAVQDHHLQLAAAQWVVQDHRLPWAAVQWVVEDLHLQLVVAVTMAAAEIVAVVWVLVAADQEEDNAFFIINQFMSPS
jgi:hypothetical protein